MESESEFIQNIRKIKRAGTVTSNIDVPSPSVHHVLSILSPIVHSLAAAEPDIIVTKSKNKLFITNHATNVCVLVVDASAPDDVTLRTLATKANSVQDEILYSGTLNETAIVESTEAFLLKWYQSLFTG